MNANLKGSLRDRCSLLVASLGLADAGTIGEVSPLSGGVSSDIATVQLPERTVCIKFALEKLRVAEDWRAPVARNAAEYAWIEFAGSIVPGCTPELLGRDEALNGFAMEFLTGDDIYLWKTALLSGTTSGDEGRKVGDVLGRIHAASVTDELDSTAFQNQQDFSDLRLDPFLLYTGSVHNELAGALARLAESQGETLLTLIHGDVSPKNILFRNGRPVFLDAECATMGDPGFDVSFCLNHLALKAFHRPSDGQALLAEFSALWMSYSTHVDWEDVDKLERRICDLLPALMLARIDGKSPVEYLDRATRDVIRRFAKPLVLDPPESLNGFKDALREQFRALAA